MSSVCRQFGYIAALLLSLPLVVGAAEGPAVELPPMVVEESATLKPWLYLRVGDTEYLSRCSTGTTRGYAQMQHSRMQWLHGLFPPELFLEMDVPRVTVLVGQQSKLSTNAELAKEIMAAGEEAPASRGHVRATMAPNMMLNDEDSVAVFVYVDEARFERDRLTVSSDYVRFLLERRRPTLPVWLLEGVMSVYNDIVFTERPITLRAMAWPFPHERAALLRNPDAPRTLVSARDLFALPVQRSERIPREAIALAQCGLLVRWALDPRNGVRDAFWRFATAASDTPVTEPMFEAHFGFGFSDLRDRLSEYLPFALKEPLRIELPRFAMPALDVRRATPNEIARLRGEWERHASALMRRRHPAEAPRYVAQARRTLQRAYDANDRDPRLLASLGLCELESGNRVLAREYLEHATRSGVVRPRAYLELARLRWEDRTQGEPPEREIGGEEVIGTIHLLGTALAQAPISAEAAGLLAEIWARAAISPTQEELATLRRLGAYFVSEPWLCLRFVRALQRHGETDEARALLERGFRHAGDERTQQQFAQWYNALTKDQAAPP